MKYKLTQRKGRSVQVMYEGTNKWVSTGCMTKEEAILKIERGNFLESQMTLGIYAKDFYTRTDPNSYRFRREVRENGLVEGTYANKQGRLDKYILPRFGKYKLSDLTPREIDEWFITLDRDISAYTRNDILYILCEILDKAITDGLLADNPARKVKPMRYAPKRRASISQEELDIILPENVGKLLKVWGGANFACIFMIEKETGFRPGEVFGLSWDSIDYEKKVIYTEQSVSSYERKLVKRIKTTQTGKRYKVGTISDTTIELLKIIKETNESDLVFVTNTGKLYNATYANEAFKLRTEKYLGRKDLTQYCLRHAFMTNLIDKLPKDVVMELMGHTKYEETYDDSTKEQIINRLLKKLNS